MGDIPLKDAKAQVRIEEPDFLDQAGNALRTESMFGAMYERALVDGLIDPDSPIFPNPRNVRRQEGFQSPGRNLEFNVLAQPEVKANPAILSYVWDSEGRQDFLERIELQRSADEARAELAKSNNATLFILGASFVNPDVFIGGGVAAGVGRVGGALRTAGALGTTTGIQESVLQSNEPGRDVMAGPAAVLASTIVGFGLGLALPASKSLRRPDIPLTEAQELAKRARGPSVADFIRAEDGTLNMNPNRPGGKRSNESIREQFEATMERERNLNREAPKRTGIGIEKLDLNPVLRTLKRNSVIARKTVEELVDMGGIIKNKNKAGTATSRSVETNYRNNYLKDLFDGIETQNTAFLKHRGKTDPGGPGRRVLHSQATRLADSFRGSPAGKLSFREFREQTGLAMKRGDAHEIPEVAEAAAAYRKILNRMGKDAHDSGLFERALRRDLNNLERQLSQAAKKGEDLAAFQRRKIRLQEKLDKLRAHGPDAGRGQSFFPRIYRQDRILDNQDRFVSRVADGLREANPGMTAQAARVAARDVMRNISGIKPHIGPISGELRKGAGDVTSARARMLDIDDKFLEEFVENDVEVVIRSYHKAVGTDIEMTKMFGDISMAQRIIDITAEFDAKIAKTKNAAEAARLVRDRDGTITDIEAMRDIVRGTFGASNDPFSSTTKFVKLMKAANVTLMLGGAAISSFSDVGRLAMTEGIAKGYGPILTQLHSKNGKLLRAMSRKDMQLSGEALDMVLGLRALQMADIGQAFGNLSRVERVAQDFANQFFMVNGLNWWNNTMKEWAGLVVGNRILDASGASVSGAIKQTDIEKLARSGINPEMASKINDQFVRFGDTIDGVKVANTADWVDAEAIAAYRGALSQDVNRTIVTPGAGDKALWTSTEMGSMVAQFKSFAQASTNRVLVSGLQESDSNMMVGAAILLGLGAGVASFKDFLAGREQADTVGEVVEGAIDRSGLFGVFQEFNKIAEVMSNGQLGLRPMLTGDTRPPSGGEVAGQILGPTGSTISRGAQVAGDIISGNADSNTLDTAARLVPGNNLPFVEPLR